MGSGKRLGAYVDEWRHCFWWHNNDVTMTSSTQWFLLVSELSNQCWCHLWPGHISCSRLHFFVWVWEPVYVDCVGRLEMDHHIPGTTKYSHTKGACHLTVPFTWAGFDLITFADKSEFARALFVFDHVHDISEQFTAVSTDQNVWTTVGFDIIQAEMSWIS